METINLSLGISRKRRAADKYAEQGEYKFFHFNLLVLFEIYHIKIFDLLHILPFKIFGV